MEESSLIHRFVTYAPLPIALGRELLDFPLCEWPLGDLS